MFTLRVQNRHRKRENARKAGDGGDADESSTFELSLCGGGTSGTLTFEGPHSGPYLRMMCPLMVQADGVRYSVGFVMSESDKW